MRNLLILYMLANMLFPAANCQNIKLTKAWETDSVFFMPESAVYDSIRGYIYISNVNYKGEGEIGRTKFNECISRLEPDGKITDLRWIDSLLGPAGITIYNDRLYAVERGFLAEINIQNHKIIKHYPIPDFGFPNDIAFDKSGIAYITDSEKNCIYRFDGESVEKWLSDSLFSGINGLFMITDTLIVGNSGNNSLLAVTIADKKVVSIALNAIKFVDGIVRTNHQFIITGGTRIKLLDANGNCTELMASNNDKEWYADIYFIKIRRLLIIPTLFTNRVVAFKLSD